MIIRIPGFEHYFASNDGNIYSSKKGELKQLSNKKHTSGYYQVMLCYGRKNQSYRYVHRLIALAFFGQPNGKMDVNHIDGNKRNNGPENLEWCTRSENQIHAYNNRIRTDNGEGRYNSVLTESKVRLFRYLHENKIGDPKEMAKVFKVNHRTLLDAIDRKTWKHIN
jgi:HNH endonuclease/NUMOD4 motif